MEINIIVIAIIIIATLLFVYFVVKRNRKDLKELEKELNEKDFQPKKHDENHI